MVIWGRKAALIIELLSVDRLIVEAKILTSAVRNKSKINCRTQFKNTIKTTKKFCKRTKCADIFLVFNEKKLSAVCDQK